MNFFDESERIFSIGLFHRWHPEVAIRYLPVVSEIRKVGREATILDVGSGGLGIAPYIGKHVTGVDVHFSPPFSPLLKKVHGSALALPFLDALFDVVVCVDTLEHLAKSDRKQAICEMLRVAREKVVLAVPCGDASQRQDEELAREYWEKHSKRFHFLEEQVAYGLSSPDALASYVRFSAEALKKTVRLTVYDNENLSVRKFLMRGWMSQNILVNIFHRKILLLFLPLLVRLNYEPAYRKIFVIDILHEGSD